MARTAIRRTSIYAFLLIIIFTSGVSTLSFATQGPSLAGAGVVVEKVTHGSEADKAGIAAGDTLLKWSGKTDSGQIDSPFDLLRIEVEQAPFGAVAIEGRSADKTKKWDLGQQSWGLKVGPNFDEQTLALYASMTPPATAGNNQAKELAAKWRTLADDARKNGAPAWMISWLFLHAAEAIADTKDWDSADDACKNAISISPEAPYGLSLLKACSEVFFLHERKQDRALRYLQLALARSQKENPRSLTTAVLLSNVGRLQDDLAKAEEMMLQAIDIQEQLVPGSLALAYNENRVGVFFQNSGNLELAKKYLRRSLDIREKLIPDSSVLSSTLQNMGDALTIAGDLNEAVEYQHRACAMREKLEPDGLALAGCFVDAGTAEENRSNFAKAEEYFQRALAIQRRISPRGMGAGASLNNLGNVQEERGQLLEAMESFTQAYSIQQEVAPDSLISASPLSNLGRINGDLGNFEKAEGYLLKATAIREKLAPGSSDLGLNYNALGELYLAHGDYDKARAVYSKGETVLKASIPNGYELGDSFQGLARTYEKTGDLAAAEESYLKALEIRGRVVPGSSKHALTLMALAELKRRSGQFKQSQDYFLQAADAIDNQASRLGGGEQTVAGFRAEFENGYKNQIDLLISQGKPQEAFQIVERLHARTLLETLAAARVEIKKGNGDSLAAEEHNLQIEISSKSNARLRLLADNQTAAQAALLEKDIKTLLDRDQVIKEKIRESNPAYAALTQPHAVSLRDAQRLLDGDTLLLEYSLGEDRSYVFVLTPTSIKTFALPKRAEIERQARLVHQLLTDRNRNAKDESGIQRAKRWSDSARAYDLAAADLSRMLLGPIARQLTNKRLLVVADGALHYLPFSALPEPATVSGSPLVARHEVVNLPSASVLALLRREGQERKPATSGVAIFADPVFDQQDPRVTRGITAKLSPAAVKQPTADPKPENKTSVASLSASLLTRSALDLGLDRSGQLALPRLRFTREEADAIYAVTPHTKALEATGFQATRAGAINPILAKYRILHFATHGLLNSQHPELSGLVFSLVDKNGDPQDGFLTLQDIYNLNLNADLVVLSACETGLGKEISGEGIIGLTRGFMYAGSRRVVASLWNVSDVATARLMAEFYRAMEKDGLSPAAALRAAQIKMQEQKRWTSPYYWAAFQLQGDWK